MDAPSEQAPLASSAASRRFPAALLAAFALLALAWSLITPVFEAPDESTHFFVAEHIARTGRLPVQTLDVSARGPWQQEGSQPPLYYALAAPLLRQSGVDLSGEDIESRVNPQNSMGNPAVVGNDNRFVHADEGWPWPAHVWAVRLARGLSILLGLVAVAATWALAMRVFGGGGGADHARRATRASRPWLAFAVTALFAFNPQMIATFSALSNDPAIITLAALALWLLVRLWDGRDDGRTVIGLAIVVGLAPLAKVSGLAVVAFALLTIAGLAWRRRDAGWGLRIGGMVVASTLLLAGWWYLRNLRLYGSLTGLNYMLPEGVGRELNWARWLRGLPAELLGIWRSSWGLFGWFTLPLPDWVYGLIDAATVAAGAGLAASVVRGRGGRRPEALEDRASNVSGSSTSPGAFASAWPRLLWAALWWGLMFAALLRWLLLVKGGHGRLLFPAWVAVALLLVVGWRALLPRRVTDRGIALTVASAMLVLSTGALFGVIRPAFAAPPTIAESAIPETVTRVDALFGDGLRLLAVEHPERVAEGELLPVTLYWWVEGEISRPGLVALRLDQVVASTGENPAEGRGASGYRPDLIRLASDAYLAHPGAGTSPLGALPSGIVVVDRHHVPVPALAATLPAPGVPFVSWAELDAGIIALADSAVLESTGAEERGAEAGRRTADLLTRLGPGARGARDEARRFTMPVEARLSIHVYDRDAAAAWSLSGADAAVGVRGVQAMRTDVERRVVIDRARGRSEGPSIAGAAVPAASFGLDPVMLRMGLIASVTRGSMDGDDALFVADRRPPSAGGGRRGDLADGSGSSTGGNEPQALLRHVVPDPRELSITWTATRVVWSVERAPERDLAVFAHLVDDQGEQVSTFDGDPVTHGEYPSSRWQRGDVLVADLGWRVPDHARPGDRFTLLVGLYERAEGAPRLPAFDPGGERYLDDAVPLVAIEVAPSSGGPLLPDWAP